MIGFLLWAASVSPVAASCFCIGYQNGRKPAERRATRPVDAVTGPRRPDVTPDPGEALMPHARAVLDAIRAHPPGGPPTAQDLAAVTGLTPAMVRQQVRILGRDGQLRRDPTALWGIEVDDSEGVAP